LAPLVDAHGPLTLSPSEDLFARLVRSVLRQQVSTDAADAIETRLRERVTLTPAALLAADPETLWSAGVSEAKTRYLRSIAEAWQREGYDRETFAAMDDDAVRAELTAITGVGEWTADVFLLFGLGREDVFPVGDLAIRRGMRRLFGVDAEDRAAMREVAERWRPYRSYAALYVWRQYEAGEGA
jgi:DNA-3-methyladenine glycosylase II